MEQKYNCKLRVLVVEADPTSRAELVRQLGQRDFAVYYAEGAEDRLLDDARDKVTLFRCHVVVVAPPASNHLDPQVYLQDLNERLAPAGIVLYAPQPDDRLAFAAGRMGLEYLRQEDPLSDLVAALDAQGRRACRCHLAVTWPGPAEEFVQYVTRTLKMASGEVTLDDLHDLFGRVFHQATAVHLRALPSFGAGTTPVRRAAVLWASEQHHLTSTRRIPKAIKIGPSDQIRREMQNYYRYVDGWLFQNRQARLEGYTLLWHVGAIVYAFLGASPEQMVSFREFYDRNTPPQTLEVLRRLFVDTCRNWYWEEREKVQRARLFDFYNPRLNLEMRLKRMDTESPRVTFPDYPDELPNPAHWLADEGMELAFDEATTCITHGDLHADNIFIDQSDQAWLIDFEHTGPAHALRDFIELEADIKLRLTPYAGDALPMLAALERALMTGDRLAAMLTPPPDLAAHPELHKAFQVVAGLRHLAHIATGVTDLREYLHALLYETLFMATLSRLSPDVQRRASFSAALIVERLKDGPRESPPVPRLDLTALAGESPAQQDAAIQAHKQHLHACHQAAMLQKALYRGTLPHDLVSGLALIREEAAQTQRAQEMMRPLG